ncbi:cytochrome c family protein [Hyphobacterium sp. HN65]|uniref:Cytochrome c family protein n=1 Tax=Hyphobacterium lacteum TaxID=3116575 RepID=A0ABU7LTD8_9PROT|nr:cytochrome c family protein [Hyphobacterium sp. HN65]MEE2527186.1 cytochrome c family protein [Hyphobacterium sp. HN65]
MRWIATAFMASLLAACGNSGSGEDTGATAIAPEPAASVSNASDETAPPAPPPSVDLSALPAPYDTADYDAGRRQFRRCSSCHTLDQNGSHRVGPNLYGLFGREAGSADNFNYSNALSGAGFIWTPEQLDEWLANPREFLPGNRMSFVGLREEEDRRNVIAYLLHETAAEDD